MRLPWLPGTSLDINHAPINLRACFLSEWIEKLEGKGILCINEAIFIVDIPKNASIHAQQQGFKKLTCEALTSLTYEVIERSSPSRDDEQKAWTALHRRVLIMQRSESNESSSDSEEITQTRTQQKAKEVFSKKEAKRKYEELEKNAKKPLGKNQSIDQILSDFNSDLAFSDLDKQEIQKCLKRIKSDSDSKKFIKIYLNFVKLICDTFKNGFEKGNLKETINQICELFIFTDFELGKIAADDDHNICQVLKTTLINKFVRICVDELSGKDDYFKNEISYRFFSKKIIDIVFSAKDEKLKWKIISNIFKNFEQSKCDFIDRFQRDQEYIIHLLKLPPQTPLLKIQKLEILGDETHRKNMGVFKVTFTSDEVIIYKPRSMLPEKVVCDLFGQIEPKLIELNVLPSNSTPILGKYHVIDRGNYGYCEFLENKLEENVLASDEEVKIFLKKVLILEALAKKLGISDLHQDNIFIVKKCPCISDGEVILLPLTSAYDTNLMDEGLDSLPQFHNRVFNSKGIIESELLKLKLNELKNDKTDFQELIKIVLYKDDIKNVLSASKNTLGSLAHRIVIISTQSLKNIILLESEEEAFREFMECLKKSLFQFGIELSELEKNVEMEIKNIFIEDFENGDVPIFYVDNMRNVYYHSFRIATIPEQKPIKIISSKKLEKFGKRSLSTHDYKEMFEKLLRKQGIEPKIETEDVASLIDAIDRDRRKKNNILLFQIKDSGKVYYKGIFVGNLK